MDESDVHGDFVDPANLEPEVEAPPEAPPEPVHEPPVDSPRWNEVYGKMKDFERQLEEKDELTSAAIKHNESLQARVDEMDARLSVGDMPDQITDPEGHARWVIDQAKREMALENKPTVAPPVTPKEKPKNKIQDQTEMLRSVHKDFNQVASLANELIGKDPLLKNEILFSDNPPRALYEYGLKAKAAQEQSRANGIAQASVEGGGRPPTDTGTFKLTPQQEHARKALGVSEKDYIKQLQIINKKRG